MMISSYIIDLIRLSFLNNDYDYGKVIYTIGTNVFMPKTFIERDETNGI